jgi:hypothetical protein
LKVDPNIDSRRSGEERFIKERMEGYIHFWVVELKQNPNCIQNYLMGITAWLGKGRVTPEATLFKLARKRIEITELIEGHVRIFARTHPLYLRRKVPFLMNYFEWSDVIGDNHYRQRQELMDRVQLELYQLRLQTALRCGFFFLLRRSEFLPGMLAGQEDRGGSLRWSQVQFRGRGKRVMTWGEMVTGQPEVEEITATILWSKTDRLGATRPVTVRRVSDPGAPCAIRHLVRYLTMGWTSGYIQSREQEVFRLASVECCLTDISDHLLRQVLDLVAVKAKIKEGRLVPHSLRVGGATGLGASNAITVQDLCIQGGGSIKSAEIILRYARASRGQVDHTAIAFDELWTGAAGLQDQEADVWG